MISRLRVQNFKALEDVDVALEPLTVLVGPNESGKSSFLEAIHAVAKSPRAELKNCFLTAWEANELVYGRRAFSASFGTTLVNQAAADLPELADREIAYELSIEFIRGKCNVLDRLSKSDTRMQFTQFEAHDPRPTHLRAFSAGSFKGPDSTRQLAGIAINRLPAPILIRWEAQQLARPSELPATRSYPLEPNGYGCTCVAELKLQHESHFSAVRSEFCRMFPSFRDIAVRRTTINEPSINAHSIRRGIKVEGYDLLFIRTDGVEIPAAVASGGVLVSLAFLTVSNLPDPRRFFLIEEPENGLHPARLGEVVQLLQGLVERKSGAQVVITTHSPLLLDYVRPEQIRIFRRNEGGKVEVHNLADVPDIQDRLKYLTPGELLYNEGEDQIIEEIREHAAAGRG